LKTRFLMGVAAAAFIAIYVLHVPFPAIVAGAALLGFAVHAFTKYSLAPHWLPAWKPDEQQDGEGYVIDRLLTAGHLEHLRPSWKRTAWISIVSLLLWMVPVVAVSAWLGADHVLSQEARFFSKTAVVTFGGAYAVLAYVAQRVVEGLHWLRPGEMVDGLALAETTPGPLIMVLQFVGFLAAYRYAGPIDPWLAAVLGALLTTWVTFVPCFLFVFVGAPYVETLRHNRALHAALSAITAAVVGVILNLSLWFALHTLFSEIRAYRIGPIELDLPTWMTLEPVALLLSAAALIVTLRFKWGMGWTLLACGVLGWVYRSL
jgi:chromate transporter